MYCKKMRGTFLWKLAYSILASFLVHRSLSYRKRYIEENRRDSKCCSSDLRNSYSVFWFLSEALAESCGVDTGNIWLVLLPCCCDLRRKMYVSMLCFFRCETGALTWPALTWKVYSKHRWWSMGLLTWEQHCVFPWLILCKNLINCISQQHSVNCSKWVLA